MISKCPAKNVFKELRVRFVSFRKYLLDCKLIPQRICPCNFAEKITDSKSEKKKNTSNFSEFNTVSFCYFHKPSFYLDDMSVHHPIKVLKPDQNAGISWIFCEPDGQHAGISTADFVNLTVKMLELLGLFMTCMVKMLEFSGPIW